MNMENVMKCNLTVYKNLGQPSLIYRCFDTYQYIHGVSIFLRRGKVVVVKNKYIFLRSKLNSLLFYL